MKPSGGGTGTKRLKGLALGILAAVRLAAAEALLFARYWFYIAAAPIGWIFGGFNNDCLVSPCGIYFEFKLPGLFI